MSSTFWDQDATEHILDMNQYAPVMELVLTQLAQGVNKAFCFRCVDACSLLWSKESNAPNTSVGTSVH